MSKRQNKNKTNHVNTQSSGIRMDKWLWAARFFKTRSIAKQAIEGGKVHLNGERVKVSREVHIGMVLTIQQGIEKKTVVVKDLSDVRSSAPIAQQLYEETAESIEKRAQQAEQRKLNSMMFMSHRPNKKDRRDIDKFHQQYDFADDFSDDMVDSEDGEWDNDDEDWEDDEE